MSKIYNCSGHSIKIPNIVDSDGAYLFDDSGKKYLDLESGVWCTSLGHKNARVNQAIKDQIDSVMHTGFCYSNEIVEQAAQSVLDISGIENGKCVFLCSGSEAIELARQITRQATGNSITMALHDAYFGSYSSTQDKDKDWYLFDWRECADCQTRDNCDAGCPKLQNFPDNIAEFLFEPGSSSGFVRFPPASLIRNIVKIVREKGGKIVANEVTTGIGRTGKWFGFEHYGITPDIITIGKGVGNGYPVSVMVLDDETIADLEGKPFSYMQSHQNDPLGAAVVKAVIETLTDEDLIARAETLGSEFLAELETLLDGELITDVRGRGFIYAVEFREKNVCDRIYEALLENGYIVCNRGGMFRIDPPLSIDRDDFFGFVGKFRELLVAK